MGTKLQLFNDKKIRTSWNAEEEEWYFSVVDIVAALTDSNDYQTTRKYWNKLKRRLLEEGNETVTNCHQLKMPAMDGKMRMTDVLPTTLNCSQRKKKTNKQLKKEVKLTKIFQFWGILWHYII